MSDDRKPAPGALADEPTSGAPAESPAGSGSLPDPKAAALDAARIAGELVEDIESAGGAAIVAAAAAGAAIEAARVRARVIADGAEGNLVPLADASTNELASADPVVTVRMHRDRILRALAEDAAAAAAASSQPGATTGSSAQGGSGEEDDEEAADPVQVAAAALHRLRERARTDLAELKVVYHRHDLLVLFLALVIIVVAGRTHARLVTPPTTTFSERGLTFAHSQAWLPAEPVATPPPRIVHDLAGQTTSEGSAFHVAFTSTLDPSARIEVLIDRKPAWSNIVTGLELDRRTRWGELYTLDDSSVRSIAGHDWLRTAYRFAHVADKGDVPRVDPAVEYATIDRDQIYVITLFGAPAQIAQIEAVLAPTLRVPTRTALPLVPQERRLSQRTYPNAVARAFDSTVMVVAADLIDGRLRPRGGGSGVVVGNDGSILTNHHVIHDPDGRPHDVFVIARFSQPDHAPQLWCAGRPDRSKLQPEQDLALIKCDLDLDGRAWNPATGGIWATLPEARTADVRMGQRLWVLGYPDVGGGGLTLSQGEVEGWTGANGAAGHDFLRTDASITHGNSGGPVVDDQGRLVGIASAFRARKGLVRPLSAASCLLSIAVVGWTPREDHNDCDLQPSAVEAPAEGVRISTKIVDAANDAPVRDALLMVLRRGVGAKHIDVNRLDDLVLAWGRTNTQGEVMLKQPVPAPGTYTVMVVATGYEPLVGDKELRLDESTPPHFDPWGTIWIRSR